MSQASMNPFRPTRWEHQRDGHQLIWYSNLADTLSGEKSFYISGSRGSGKTTLLRSVCWEDLVKNTSLKIQRTLAQAESIGCYIRFPDHLTSSLSGVEWNRIYPQAPNPDLECHRYFSLLVELTCAERAVSACHELRVSEFAVIQAKDEFAFTQTILSEYTKLDVFAKQEALTVKTLPDLCRLFRSIAREMNQAAGRGTVRELNEQLPAREPGELLAFIARKLSDIVRLKGDGGLRSPGFKFCLDDCEVLDPSQQVSINTLVRICKYPVSWVVSYVGSQFENNRTYIENQTLSDADRRVESLDRRTADSFRELCQAVVSLRLLFEVSESHRTARRLGNITDFFNLRQRLGTRSVNDMMDAMTKRSARPLARTLRECSEGLRVQLKQGLLRGESSAYTLPLYQTYTLLHWQPTGGLTSFKSEIGPADIDQLLQRASLLNTAGHEAWLRRKQRAALLHFAATIGAKTIPLAGDDIIISLADGSIRDFLEILGFVYEAYAKRHRLDLTDRSSLDQFAVYRTQISAAVQTEGIYNASAAYHSGVGARADKEFDAVLRLIEGLGHYTSLLQSNPSDPTVFGRAERGIFSVKFEAKSVDRLKDAKARERLVWSTIRQAELSGYLRTVDISARDTIQSEDPSEGALYIRLHRRFAPYFRFSYRGPYEVSSISASDLWLLCDRANPIEPRSWAETMAGKPEAEEQPSFTFSWVSNDE